MQVSLKSAHVKYFLNILLTDTKTHTTSKAFLLPSARRWRVRMCSGSVICLFIFVSFVWVIFNVSCLCLLYVVVFVVVCVCCMLFVFVVCCLLLCVLCLLLALMCCVFWCLCTVFCIYCLLRVLFMLYVCCLCLCCLRELSVRCVCRVCWRMMWMFAVAERWKERGVDERHEKRGRSWPT